MILQIVSKIFSVIYLFVIFAAEQGGSGLTVFDSCYIPGSLLSLIWSKLMKRRQGQHQPWAGAALRGDTELGGIWKGRSSQGHLLHGLHRESMMLACLNHVIGSKLLRKERLLAAGTNWGVTNGIPEEMSCYLVRCLPSRARLALPDPSVIFIEH